MRTGLAPSLAPVSPDRLASWAAHARHIGQSFLLAVGVKTELGDLLALARAATAFPQVGWIDVAEQTVWFGVGAADEILAETAAEAWAAPDLCRERLENLLLEDAELESDVRYFGGLAFDPQAAPHADWPEGMPARFVLPSLLLHQRYGDPRVHVTVIMPVTPEDDEQKLARRLQALLDSVEEWRGNSSRMPPPVFGASRVQLEDERSRWADAVHGALSRSDRIPKLVLSREIRLEARSPLDPWALLSRLERHTAGHRFCFRFQESHAFVGATPERLIAIEGRRLRSDCLAGTVARGTGPESDERFATLLLASDKDRREHAFVVDAIREGLAPFCKSLDVGDAPQLLKLPTVQHLHTPVAGELKPGVALGDVLAALHPTPAVGGVPREAARMAISQLEDRSRGWYAGAVGWISRHAADFAVGIRSALLTPQGAIVFSGGGIVPGSDPEAEYDETERKASGMVALLEGRDR